MPLQIHYASTFTLKFEAKSQWGVVALRHIKLGEFIDVFSGELNLSNPSTRPNNYQLAYPVTLHQNSENAQQLDLSYCVGSGYVIYKDIDPQKKGSISRFFNSPLNCDKENIKLIFFLRKGTLIPVFYATRDIEPGEELLAWFGRPFTEKHIKESY